MPYSRENLVHILFFIWWVSSPLLHPNWHQFTLGYANPGLWVIRAVIPPPRDKNHCGSCVKLCCHRLACQACVWWLSFIQHLPRVSFIFILQLHLVLSRDVRGSPSSHLFEMRPRLTGGDRRGSFFFHFLMKYYVSIGAVCLCCSLSAPAVQTTCWISRTCDPVPNKHTDAAVDGFTGFSGYS